EPRVPEAWSARDSAGQFLVRELRGVRYRGATLDVKLFGAGSCGVSQVFLDRQPAERPEVAATLTGPHEVILVLQPCVEGAPEMELATPVTAPETPVLVRDEADPASTTRAAGPARGARATLRFTPVPGLRYVFHANGVPVDSMGATRGRAPVTRLVPVADTLVEWQLEAVDSLGERSFLSEPVRVIAPAGERLVQADRPVMLTPEIPAFVLPASVPAAGRYAIDVRYANGHGPVNTEDKAAVRTVVVDGRVVGTAVMPQRGAGNWSEQGWSTVTVATLAAGARTVGLVWDPRDANMNGRENSVLVHAIRLTRLADLPPEVEKVEPPDWWVGHTVNPVRLLVRGAHLTGAQVTCGPLACANVKVNGTGGHLFVDVTIPPQIVPGRYPVVLRTAAGEARFDFTVHPRVAREGRFGGITAEDVVYLIMPDRFANGDPTNDDPARSRGQFDRGDMRKYHGGDLEGVRQRLPYLKDLGVTAVWLTPVIDQVDSIAHRGRPQWAPNGYTDYHGYGTVDPYAIEEHLGDLAAYRRLVADAHRLGMKVVFDHVANHVGPEHPWTFDAPTPTWFNGTAEDHLPNNWQMGALTDPYAARAVTDSTLKGWFAGILPDFDQDDPEVKQYLIQNALWWIATAELDAIRQDTWVYAPRTFWRDWMAALHREHPRFTVVGEVLNVDPGVVSFFEGSKPNFDGVRTGLDQVFDFPLQFGVRRSLLRGESMRVLAQVLAQDRLYDHPERLVTVTDNHDMSRLPEGAPLGDAGLTLAYTFLFTTRGIPQLYYGDEIGMGGGEDPDNRRDFPGGWREDPRDAFTAAGRTARENAIFDHLRAVIALRKARPELRDAPTEVLALTDAVMVYRRGSTVVVLNNGREPATVVVPIAPAALARAAVLGGCGQPRAVTGGVEVRVGAVAGCVF
ncbi:MAG: cyclomaltodextrinase N-terminal domain-containing protein, partial [Gemmatimonadaceae bacterium]|nr:cyclomaltodextrinase N-terminal domain-containing protein [Gemmatimonadaceae bacterium]